MLPARTAPKYDNVDLVSFGILKAFHLIMLDEFVPYSIVGDGNCLYRAVSYAWYSDQKYHIHLGLLASIEMIIQHNYYDEE